MPRSGQLKSSFIKLIYSENATKFCEIFNLLLSYVVPAKSEVKISQKFVDFSEYMNFTTKKVLRKRKSFAKTLNFHVQKIDVLMLTVFDSIECNAQFM